MMPGIDGFYKAGTILCITMDVEAGTMSAYSSHCGADASDSAAWSTVYDSGLAPSEAVGVGLFPAVSGKGSASVRYRSAGELRFAPPSGGFVAAGAAALEQVRFDRRPTRCAETRAMTGSWVGRRGERRGSGEAVVTGWRRGIG